MASRPSLNLNRRANSISSEAMRPGRYSEQVAGSSTSRTTSRADTGTNHLSRQLSRTRLSAQYQARPLPRDEGPDSELEGDALAPSLDLLVQTARSILEPSILWPEIDSLIHILAQMELYRLQVVNQAISLMNARSHFRPRPSSELGNPGATDSPDRLTSEAKLRDLLRPERHDRLREKYSAITFAVEKSAILRRLRNSLEQQADEAFEMYWPSEQTLQHSKPSPLFLLISSMSAVERNQLEEEARGMYQEILTIKTWCADCDWNYERDAFGRRFPAVEDKKWIRPVISWMESVSDVIESIAASASDLLAQS